MGQLMLETSRCILCRVTPIYGCVVSYTALIELHIGAPRRSSDAFVSSPAIHVNVLNGYIRPRILIEAICRYFPGDGIWIGFGNVA